MIIMGTLGIFSDLYPRVLVPQYIKTTLGGQNAMAKYK